MVLFSNDWGDYLLLKGKESIPLDDAVERLLKMPGTELGYGPEHPLLPRPEIGVMIEPFLAEYPFLERFTDYVRFLKAYAGASAGGALVDGPGVCDRDYVFLSVYGLCEANDRFLERHEFKVVDDRGFYGFCELHYRYRPHKDGQRITDGVFAAEFCLDATGRRKEGVYVECMLDGSREMGTGECFWFCNSFTQWLEQLVDHQGRMPTREWAQRRYGDNY